MIRVTIFYEKKDTISGFMAEGHSGYSERGSDIVCSAVTTAVMTAANGITDVLGLNAKVKVKDGYLKCLLPKNMNEQETYGAKILTKSMYLTLKNIEEQYSDYIVIIERRCSK